MQAGQYGQLAASLLLVTMLTACMVLVAPSTPSQQTLSEQVDAIVSGKDSESHLTVFFRQHATSLNLFCADACDDLTSRKKQLQRFFRGSYAVLPTGMADTAGKTDVADVYAAHAAAYFTDASYRCRYPLTAGQLESVWQFAAGPPACATLLPFLVADDEGRRELLWIDPARVYAVHLVFAGASGSTLSRFGHVSLRLVICGEHRQSVDSGCEEDLFDHLSLGFMAGIDELDLSLWKGITGGYPVKLHARRFISAYREYSIDEFRSLHSLPLRLEPDAQDFMVRALSQVHWSYQNEYRFFTRNCATELQWLLQAVSEVANPGSQPFLVTERYRPDRLFADARKSPHFEGALLDDPREAESGGYFFPGAETYYQVAVNVFLDHPQVTSEGLPKTPEEWRLRPALLRRDTILLPALQEVDNEPGHLVEGQSGVAHTAQAGLVLEAWVGRRLRREIFTVMTTYYGTLVEGLVESHTFFTAEERQFLEGCMSVIKAGDQTGTVATGVPQQAIVPVPDYAACDVSSPELLAVMKRFYDAFPVLPEHRQRISELEDTAENIRILSQKHTSA